MHVGPLSSVWASLRAVVRFCERLAIWMQLKLRMLRRAAMYSCASSVHRSVLVLAIMSTHLARGLHGK